MANAAYRSHTTVANNTSATFSVTKPTGCVDGDLLTAFQVTALGGGTDPATPTGWTLKATQTYGASKVIQRFEKLASSEGADWTFNNAGGSPVGNESSVYCICTSPGHTESEGGADDSGTGTTADPGSYTTLEDDDLLLVCWAATAALTDTITPDASFTVLGQIGSLSGQRVNVGYKSQASAGATADTDAALSESMAWGAMSVAIAPSAGSPPVAAFSGTPLSGAASLSVTFTDASTNTPTSWLWEKNSGSGWVNFAGSPTAQNPTESFAAGTWDVRLTATNASGSDAEEKLDYVVSTAIPVASFTRTPAIGPVGTTVTFTDTSTNTPTSWAWDFGDGTTSTSQNPTKTYVKPGVYTVTMTPTNAGGAASSPATATVTITPAGASGGLDRIGGGSVLRRRIGRRL